MNDVIVTIPAYEPDENLTDLVRRLRTFFRSIVVVDDGSVRSCRPFDELRQEPGVVLLRHSANRGKGEALKTAFREILRRFPDAVGTVTVDADGQHLPDDVAHVAESLLAHPDQMSIGTRTFGHAIPFRSRLGNLWTICAFRLLTGATVRDTQTGLRAIPLRMLTPLLNVPGERYDYEIRALVKSVLQLGGVRQVPIATVYVDGNRSSHYRPLVDTLRTQKALFASAFTARFGWRSHA